MAHDIQGPEVPVMLFSCLVLLHFGLVHTETGHSGRRLKEDDADEKTKEGMVVVVARATLRPGSRWKRDSRAQWSDFHLRLEAAKPIFSSDAPLRSDNHHLHAVDIDLYNTIDLTRGFLSPNYKLIVRGQDFSTVANLTMANSSLQSCLYRGAVEQMPGSQVILSICHNQLNGVINTEDRQFVVAPLGEPEFLKRSRREEILTDGDSLRVVIYEPSGSKCGLDKMDVKRNHTWPATSIIKLKSDDSHLLRKRSTDQSVRPEKTIELAVFVDDVLYSKNKAEKPHLDPIQNIQELVFAYLASVQQLYLSDKLNYKMYLSLVRLEIMTSAVSDLDKKNGEISGYLESFCKWQQKNNVDSWNKFSTHPDHWDHGLLLTGLNLFDTDPRQDSVIGLAWVSGMCDPSHSCTVNEGNNFESVFVIAHEMGHNLGMNHDGDVADNNLCDPNKNLMSPVLGPGKVSWSSCSNAELSYFLTQNPQSVCLNDVASSKRLNGFLVNPAALPGESNNANDQCRQSFGPNFKPHVKKDKPFENVCRELWCANSTHALRAHPALEGTDCSAKPYPYGSYCIEGQCVPYHPDKPKPGIGAPVSVLEAASSVLREHQAQGAPDWYFNILVESLYNLSRKVDQEYGLA